MMPRKRNDNNWILSDNGCPDAEKIVINHTDIKEGSLAIILNYIKNGDFSISHQTA